MNYSVVYGVTPGATAFAELVEGFPFLIDLISVFIYSTST